MSNTFLDIGGIIQATQSLTLDQWFEFAFQIVWRGGALLLSVCLIVRVALDILGFGGKEDRPSSGPSTSEEHHVSRN